MNSNEEKKKLIALKMREVMDILGLDLSDPSLSKTPERIAKMYVDEIFSGLSPTQFPKLSFQEENIPQELIFIKNISLVSYCEHHFVPIIGKAHVAYFPHKKLLGLSKIPQIVHHFARRPQVQERLTSQIASSLSEHLEIDDVAVSIHAVHFCLLARGIEDKTATMETHTLKGRFEINPAIRAEFFSRLPSPEKQLITCPVLTNYNFKE